MNEKRNYDLLVSGAVVDFTVAAPEILTQGWLNVTINSVMDMSTAQDLGLDVMSMHNNIYPTIKDKGVPNDPSQYQYVRVTKPSGAVMVLGIPWINEASIKLVERHNIVVRISDVGPNDVQRIKAALESNGYPQAVVDMAD